MWKRMEKNDFPCILKWGMQGKQLSLRWERQANTGSLSYRRPTKVCLVKAMIFPVVMYGCEKKNKTQGLWENWKSSKIHIIGISEGEEILETKSITLRYIFFKLQRIKEKISKEKPKLKTLSMQLLMTSNFSSEKCKQENCMKYLVLREKTHQPRIIYSAQSSLTSDPHKWGRNKDV